MIAFEKWQTQRRLRRKRRTRRRRRRKNENILRGNERQMSACYLFTQSIHRLRWRSFSVFTPLDHILLSFVISHLTQSQSSLVHFVEKVNFLNITNDFVAINCSLPWCSFCFFFCFSYLFFGFEHFHKIIDVRIVPDIEEH